MKNTIQPFLAQLGITPYRFWHDTGISRVTAYKLYNDPTYIPGADVLVKICDTYQIQPGAILVWFSEEEGNSSDRPSQTLEQDRQDLSKESTITSQSQHRQSLSQITGFPQLPESA